MPSDPSKVIMVKLSRETHARLRAWAGKTLAAYTQGKRVPAPGESGDYSIDYAVSILLNRDLRHRKRGNKPRRVKYQG